MQQTFSSTNLSNAIDWLAELVQTRLADDAAGVTPPPRPGQSDYDPFAFFIRNYEPSNEELAVFVLALVPHLTPGMLDRTIGETLLEGANLAEVGGVRGQHHRGLLPTGETALWLLGGADLEARTRRQHLFGSGHWFAKACVLHLESVPAGEPAMSGRLVIDDDLVEFIIHGRVTPPRFSKDFPAEHISTEMDWVDLVLHPHTLAQIREIENWITFNDSVMMDRVLRKRVKPGYRALFFGPPGTGKTLTATLLGKHANRDVFRIDLSRVVSKYIGETEQNLSRLFDRAESKDWILFFDEADALFSKRTDVRDAHDKYANQEVAYLLQRIEAFDGLVILATNQRTNIDEAFVRRFQSIIHFPMPTADERYRLWTQSMPEQLQLDADLDLMQIATRYEISGASIINVVHHCSIEALARETRVIDHEGLETAIRREFTKEGKIT